MSSWSTPSAHDGRRPGSDEASTQGRNLKREAENFLADAEHTNGGGNLMATPKHTGGIDLEGAAELWPTPATDSFRSRGGDRKDEMGLDQQARFVEFPTPAARDYRSERGGHSDNEPFQPSIGSEFARHDRALFPPGPADRRQWAAILRERPDLAPATQSEIRRMASGTSGGLDFSRADQLRSLGNLVVPQQGAAALIVLLKRHDIHTGI